MAEPPVSKYKFTATAPTEAATRDPREDEGRRCCVPADGEEHCDHHPEWHDADGCNHPTCKSARDDRAAVEA